MESSHLFSLVSAYSWCWLCSHGTVPRPFYFLNVLHRFLPWGLHACCSLWSTPSPLPIMGSLTWLPRSNLSSLSFCYLLGDFPKTISLSLKENKVIFYSPKTKLTVTGEIDLILRKKAFLRKKQKCTDIYINAQRNAVILKSERK